MPKSKAATDYQVAQQLIHLNTTDGSLEIMYVPGRGWYYWNEDRWAADDTGVMTRLSLQAILSLDEEIQPPTNITNIRGAIQVAQDMPGVTIPAQSLDSDPLLLNTPDGYIDLARSTFHVPTASKRLTQATAATYDPTATCPLFKRFLEEVLPDPETRAFLKRALGYTVTGLVKEEVIFLLVGKGANGKTTLTSVIRHILGTYGRPVSTSLLTARFTGSHETEKLALQGTRFAIANETDFGAQVAEAKIKSLVSTDAITARGAYEKHAAVFQPTHKLWLSTNYLPTIDGSDEGLARRLVVIEFPRVFTPDERDPNLHAALLLEQDGILNWLIEGANEYLAHGLQIPPSIRDAVKEYQSDMDTLSQFLEESLEFDDSFSATNAEVWDAYTRWQASEPNYARLTRRQFGQAMKRRFRQKNQYGVRSWPGLQVKTAALPDDLAAALHGAMGR